MSAPGTDGGPPTDETHANKERIQRAFQALKVRSVEAAVDLIVNLLKWPTTWNFRRAMGLVLIVIGNVGVELFIYRLNAAQPALRPPWWTAAFALILIISLVFFALGYFAVRWTSARYTQGVLKALARTGRGASDKEKAPPSTHSIVSHIDDPDLELPMSNAICRAAEYRFRFWKTLAAIAILAVATFFFGSYFIAWSHTHRDVGDDKPFFLPLVLPEGIRSYCERNAADKHLHAERGVSWTLTHEPDLLRELLNESYPSSLATTKALLLFLQLSFSSFASLAFAIAYTKPELAADQLSGLMSSYLAEGD